MDFNVNKEQERLRYEVREFTKNEIVPKVNEYDEKDDFPWDVMKKAFEKGFMNVRIPKKYGGKGLTLLDEVIITEDEESQEIEQLEDVEIKPIITENDIMLVAAQANVDPKEAEAVLKDCDGDIAKAILFLKNRFKFS